MEKNLLLLAEATSEQRLIVRVTKREEHYAADKSWAKKFIYRWWWKARRPRVPNAIDGFAESGCCSVLDEFAETIASFTSSKQRSRCVYKYVLQVTVSFDYSLKVSTV